MAQSLIAFVWRGLLSASVETNMLRPALSSRSAAIPIQACMLVGGTMLLVGVIALSMGLAGDVGEGLTRNTVRLSLAWYAAALCLMMQLGPEDWRAETRWGRLARWCWTWGVVCFWVHLGMAFHYYHHWSHADAFEHTRQVAGNGQGLYVSYLFTWLWTADAIWWLTRPKEFVARSPWIDRTLHAFMLFMVFNGMVVFESGPIRWAGLILFGALAAVWLLARGLPRPRLS